MVVGQRNLIQSIETLSFKALPALETRYYDGWLLRYANGYTRRANSVNPLYTSSEDVDIKISQCEALYARKKRPTIFKMTDACQPRDLDEILTGKGYCKEAETYVYTMSLIGRGNPSDNIYINPQLTDTWINHFMRLNHVAEQHEATLRRMLALIPTTSGYLYLLADDEVVGVALGVVDCDWMGIFDVVVHPDYRGNGYGRAIMEALFHWGVLQGASTGYLQVQADNAIAGALYRSLGFEHQYAYWYRVKELKS